jgi:hypothetical protein
MPITLMLDRLVVREDAAGEHVPRVPAAHQRAGGDYAGRETVNATTYRGGRPGTDPAESIPARRVQE